MADEKDALNALTDEQLDEVAGGMTVEEYFAEQKADWAAQGFSDRMMECSVCNATTTFNVERLDKGAAFYFCSVCHRCKWVIDREENAMILYTTDNGAKWVKREVVGWN
jgi:hypothetical protein